MDTIRTYLDNMFLRLPETPETLRAKEELYAMMEDKYTELKASGKSENEAIGIVITEFGNLDELLAELSLPPNQGSDSDTEKGDPADDSFDCYQAEEIPMISADEADDFLQVSRKAATKVAFGVMLCIISPVVLIYMTGLSEFTSNWLSENIAAFLGLFALFLCVAVAVTLFISSGISAPSYQYLKKEPFRMSPDTAAYLGELHNQFRSAFAIQISVGVFFCILSVIPLLAVALLFDGGSEKQELFLITCVSLLLILVGIGVFLLVHAGMISESYKTLLGGDISLHDDCKQQASYETHDPRRRQYHKALSNAISDVYWLGVTAAYLIWSFLFHAWHISWLIWPLAGILWGAFDSIAVVFRSKR